MEGGFLEIKLDAGDYTILIEELSKDAAWIYSGSIEIFVGNDTVSSFKIPYGKRSTQRQKEFIVDAKMAHEQRVAFNMRKYAKDLFIDATQKLVWQNQTYTSEEVQAYNQNQNFKKVGSWSHVNKYCKQLQLAGFDDWRLPTKVELKKLYKKRERLKQSLRFAFWSSSLLYKRNSYAWHVNFGSGSARNGDKKYKFYVRCVRDE